MRNDLSWLLVLCFAFSISPLLFAQDAVGRVESGTPIFEKTFQSSKTYSDPFNDVDVDVIFTQGDKSWRVPTFWRGGEKWTVRFAPPSPGEYQYHLESTDQANTDLNGHESSMRVAPYSGSNPLLLHGPIRVSQSKRYFESADGKPFFWLGDTWWDGLSSRLSWEGFQTLTADRKAKGFTVIQFCAGLIPSDEEDAPIDPGFRNEGGAVWDPQFKDINPRYFDYADRRIQLLIDSGLVPAIVGGWSQVLNQIGVEKMKKHWRYIIARYGAYPVFWILGGEVFDPPEQIRKLLPNPFGKSIPGGWTEVARYVRATDPYHHPITVHELPPPFDTPLQDDSLTDFDMFQPSHMGWPAIAVSVAELDMHRALTTRTKPEVIGEIGYEGLGETQLQDFQRVAFWLDELNGAAGHTYGAVGVWESYNSDQPFQRLKWSFVTWEEGMKLPGSYQVGIGAKLLEKYEWWRFEPHPDWVTPRGTTLLEPRTSITLAVWGRSDLRSMFGDHFVQPLREDQYPAGEWQAHGGNFRLPYAAGIPGQVRFIYMPCFGLGCATPPTILRLETDVEYHAYYWEPSLGIKVDLGAIEKPPLGNLIGEDKFDGNEARSWTDHSAGDQSNGEVGLSGGQDVLATLNGVDETNASTAVDVRSDSNASLILRYHDNDNYIAATYSATDKAIFLLDRKNGVDGARIQSTPIGEIGSSFRLEAEVRDSWATVMATDGQHVYTTGIARVHNAKAGSLGLKHVKDGQSQEFGDFEARQCAPVVKDEHLERKLYDAKGNYIGEMVGPGLPGGVVGIGMETGWSNYGKEKILLLDEYRPAQLPDAGDWVLVLAKE